MLSVLLIVHSLWVAWMVLGIVLAVVAHWRPQLWCMPVFRTTHLLGLMATATVPFWNDGVCPITNWESLAEDQPDEVSGSFIIRMIRAALYLEVPPWLLTLITAALAVYCIAVYFRYPPWKKSYRSRLS
jgi:hypothetical protein